MKLIYVSSVTKSEKHHIGDELALSSSNGKHIGKENVPHHELNGLQLCVS